MTASTGTVSAWNNGRHKESGTGYGLKLVAADRDRLFDRSMKVVVLSLPNGFGQIEVNVDKSSFWGDVCRELAHQDIGIWLRKTGHAPWPKGQPPKFVLEHLGGCEFRVR